MAKIIKVNAIDIRKRLLGGKGKSNIVGLKSKLAIIIFEANLTIYKNVGPLVKN